MRQFFVAVPIAMLVVGGSTACATKKFVRTSVGEVNDKVDSMGKAVEETQERTRQNEGKIAAVDQKADQAVASAQQANAAAGEARSAAAQPAVETPPIHDPLPPLGPPGSPPPVLTLKANLIRENIIRTKFRRVYRRGLGWKKGF